MERETQQISGYFFTPEIRETLQNNPDSLFRVGRLDYAFLLGKRQHEGDPNYSVFCSITGDGQVLKEIASGGITFNDAIRSVGSETHKIWLRYERNVAQLRVLEESFGIDLSSSRTVPLDHVDIVNNYSCRFAKWLESENLIDQPAVKILTERINNFLVLTPNDRKTLLIASAYENINFLQTAKNQAINSGEWGAASEELRQAFDERLQLFLDDLAFIQSKDFGPATKFGYDDSSGNTIILAVFDDWSNGNPYSGQSLEGAIAEEVMHSASKMQQLASLVSGGTKLLYDIEEIAVEYYAIGAMRACGVEPKQIEKYASLNPDCIPLWTAFMNARGQQVADSMLFRGEAAQEDWDFLLTIVRKGLKGGE